MVAGKLNTRIKINDRLQPPSKAILQATLTVLLGLLDPLRFDARDLLEKVLQGQGRGSALLHKNPLAWLHPPRISQGIVAANLIWHLV